MVRDCACVAPQAAAAPLGAAMLVHLNARYVEAILGGLLSLIIASRVGAFGATYTLLANCLGRGR